MEILALLPSWYLPVVAFLLGVIIGSFLNVFIYRFHTGVSLSGHSHCLSCGNDLRWYELFPLFSYLVLRGRCRSCSSYIPIRYFMVELLTGILFLLVVLQGLGVFPTLLFLTVVAILVVIAVYDLAHFIIPDELVLALTVLAFLAQGYGLFTTQISPQIFFYNFIVALLGSLFLFALWWQSKGKWIGFGDVKLAFPLGLLLGYTGVFSMHVLSFWVGAVVGLVLLFLSTKRLRGQPLLRFFSPGLTMKSAVPFAPFMIIGFLLVALLGVDVVALLTYVW